MKAVILAAGKGTRMKELTNEVPKPMLKVQGKPILEHIILGIRNAGIKEFFIVTGYKAEMVEHYFGDGSPWGIQISYGRQVVQDGTGKAPEVAKSFVGQSPILLTYGDILVRPETYQRMVNRFNENWFGGVVTVIEGEDVTKGAVVLFDKDFCFTHLIEKPSAAQLDELHRQGLLKPGAPVWYNAGIYIFRPEIYQFTAALQKSPRGEYELTDAIVAMAKAQHRLAGLQIQGRWVDVRDPGVLEQLQKEAI